MINRRLILAGAAALAFTASAASAQDWKSKYPELTFAVVPAENASGVTERWTPFVAYLSKELGVKVTSAHRQRLRRRDRRPAFRQHPHRELRFGVVRARPADRRQDRCLRQRYQFRRQHRLLFGVLREGEQPLQDASTSSRARTSAWSIRIRPRATTFRASSSTRWASPDADSYFGKVVFTGSHENAMLALAQGTVDVAANQWTTDNDSTLAQMLTKGMLKNADGTPMKKDDFRIIHKSTPILNGPYAYNSELPEDLKAAIAKAFAGRADQGQGRFRPSVRRPEEGFQPRHDQGLGRDDRPDQVRRQSAQEEGVLSAADTGRGRV